MADDDKAAKKAQKAAEKAAKKEAKRAAKAAKKKGTETEEDEEEGGSGILVFLVTVVLIVIWLAVFALLIKLDVGGFGSTVLRPILQNVPYVNRILPEDRSVMETADASYNYSSLSEAIEQIKALELQLQASNTANEELSNQISQLQSEVSRLAVYEQQQAEFEELKEKFYAEVVFSDEAPDISEYQQWYESIDSEYAAELYKQVVQQETVSKEVSDYAATYASMDPAQAAALMEEMTDNLDLVAKILENMSTDARAKIMDEMDSAFAASLTALMDPE